MYKSLLSLSSLHVLYLLPR